jgi:DNA-binding MarR family transcriptional regulator
VAITSSGRAVIRRLNAARLNGLQQFIETLTDTEREALSGALSQLLKRTEIDACRLETENE